MSYGYCPLCGAETIDRERRLDGNDTCRSGHVYPSRLTLAAKPPATGEVLREAGQLLGVVGDALAWSDSLVSLASSTHAAVRDLASASFLVRVRATREQIDRALTCAATSAGWTPGPSRGAVA